MSELLIVVSTCENCERKPCGNVGSKVDIVTLDLALVTSETVDFVYTCTMVKFCNFFLRFGLYSVAMKD